MTLEDKLERSKSSEQIDYSKIGCLNSDEPLVSVLASENLRLKPIWTVDGDGEGELYADYIGSHPEYDQIYVRQSLRQKLLQVAANLPPHLQLVVHAGHRPLEVQQRVLEMCQNDYLYEHPGASAEEALAHARTYVSDPAIKLPPHCCGAAVDVELFDMTTDRYVDFGSPVNLDEDISYLHSDEITAAQKISRILLLESMLDAGFASYYAEWWHFSYGDEIWAWFYGRPTCLYGLAEPTFI